MTTIAADSRPLIFVATPCYGGLLTQDYVLSLLALVAQGTSNGFDSLVALQGHDSLITRSRNTLVAHFLEHKAATHLMFIDADIGFESTHIARMLTLDEDIVCGVYPLKIQDWGPESKLRMTAGEDPATAVLRYVGMEEDRSERRGAFVTAEYAGTGFMLIKREALERMIEAYPETRYSSTHAYAKSAPKVAYALFECEIDTETGLYLSEDFAFCRRFRAIGGKIWIDTEGLLTHVGSHPFTGNPGLRFPVRMTGEGPLSLADTLRTALRA